MPLKASYLVMAGVGGIVVFAGLKGYGISSTVRDILSGKNPNAAPTTANTISAQTYALGPANTAGGTSGGPAAGGLAGIAESHVGFPYTWGGAPASGSTDCSGFVNMCCAQAGLAIPGFAAGTFTGATHGPNTLMWLAWGAAGNMTSIPRASAQAGDLVIWQTHMGIVIDNGTNMVSDLTESLGTLQTTINGGAPPGEVASFWRLT